MTLKRGKSMNANKVTFALYRQERRAALLVGTLLLVFSLSNLANAATIAFKPPVSYPVGTNPMAVSVGDFNGDGKLDLAIVNHGFSDTADDGGVSVLLGNGDGTFQAARNFGAGKQPESVALADIDPYYVVAGDFNNDHKWDVAVSGLGRDLNGDGTRDSAGGTTILLGNGDGTFQTHGPLMPLTLSLAADFNQDARLDLAVVMFPGFDLFLGTGDGSFQEPTSNTVVGGVGNAVDFNGDGKLDLVAFLPQHVCGLKLCDGQVSVLLGNGDGTFSSSFSQTGPYRTLTVGDFDADGNLDLAVTDVGNASHILRGNGSGNFGAGGTFVVSNTLSFPHLLAADFNGDNLADLVSTADGNTIAVQLNATPPDFLFDVSPASVPPVRAGESATLTLTAVPQAGFGADITLSCSSPTAQGIKCSVSPSSVAPRSTATLTVTTAGPSAALTPRRTVVGFLYAFCLPTLGLAFAGFSVAAPRQRKRQLASSLLPFLLFAGVLLQAACGGNTSNHNHVSRGTPAGTYTITITGTSGSTQHSTTTTLTVQ